MKAHILTLLFIAFAASTFATPEKKTLKIRIQSEFGYLEETEIYFDPGTSEAYFYPEDAPYVADSSLPGPAIYSLTSDNVACSINGYGDLSQTSVIALGVVVDSNSTYVFTVSTMQNFDSTSIITLEDRQQHTLTNLRTDFYQAHINTTDSAQGRFFVHVSKAVQMSTAVAGCANNDGSISVTADTSFLWNFCVLYDSDGAKMSSYANINGQFSFSHLFEGNYYIRFTYGNYTTDQNLFVNGTHVVVQNIAASPQSAVVGDAINFSSEIVNASGFLWDFGDGSLIDGIANPTFAYYIPGNFTVKLVGSNTSGCSDSAILDVAVSVTTSITSESNNPAISVITQGKTVTVNMNDVPYMGAKIEVYNLVGQEVYSNPVNQQIITLPLSQQPVGYYVVTIRNAGKINSKKVFINN